MKTIFAFTLLTLNAFGQISTDVFHIDRIGHNDLHSTRVDLVSGASYARFPFLRVDPQIGSDLLSGISVPTLAAITGGTSSQSVNIASTDGFQSGDFALIDAGLSTQEMVGVDLITDATHFSAVVYQNHASGARVRKVFSAFSKHLWTNANTTSTAVNNITFIREGALPTSAYDSYKLIGGTGFSSACTSQQDSYMPDLYWTGAVVSSLPPVPQRDPALVSATGVPTNGVAITSFAIGEASPHVCVQVFVMFTSIPEPSMLSTDYRFYWDY